MLCQLAEPTSAKRRLMIKSMMEIDMAKIVWCSTMTRGPAIRSLMLATIFPKITKYPDGQTTPTPHAIDFIPGHLLGSVSGELGLRKYLESNGHTLVVTSSKDGANSQLDKELPDAEIVISQPSGLPT